MPNLAGGDGAYALALSIVVTVIYLLVLRALDPNEKEPLWGIGLLFAAGTLAGALVHLVADSTLLTLNLWGGTFAIEAAKLVAIAVGIGALQAIGRMRGWSEVNGVLDGVVYGASAGLGLAVGATFVTELTFGSSVVSQGVLGQLWPIALLGLAEGVFGALIGAGFGAAAARRDGAAGVALPILGFVSAVLAHAGYSWLRTGSTLGGAGTALHWASLALPVLIVAAVIVYGLRNEKRAIAEELADEAGAGVVSEDELALLRSVGARRRLYLQTVLRGDVDEWSALHELHNRQVQLALAERRHRLATDSDRRAELIGEVQRLRASILAIKQQRHGVGPAVATSMEGGR